jgi:hypothetical protein
MSTTDLAEPGPSRKRCGFAILAVWAGCLVLLGALQVAGTGLGYDVWPLREDLNWIRLLQQSLGSQLTRLFWEIDNRNPLSPWWYLAAAPLIMGVDWGLYAVRKLMDPLLAVATFLLLDRLTGGRSRFYALSTALVILVWNFSRYIEQITWNFLGALALSLFCIWAYLVYADSGRKRVGYYALSLLLWFGAFATYTLQSGAILAIALIAFLRAPVLQAGSRWGRLWIRMRAAALDAWPYAALFILFLMVWTTLSGEGRSPYQTLQLQLAGTQLWVSIRNAIWHDDFLAFLRWPLEIASGFGLLAAIAMASLAMIIVLRALHFPLLTRGGEPTSEMQGPVFCLAVIACLVLPTIILEATSATWFPGTRTPMVQQVWSPVLYCTIIVVCAAGIARVTPSLGRPIAAAGMAILFGIAILVGLGYNRQLVQMTATHRALANGLRLLAAEAPGNLVFILRPNVPWLYGDTLSDVFVQTLTRRPNVHMRVLQSDPPPEPAWAAWWRVRFERDTVFVGDAVRMSGESLPYSQVRIVSFNGHSIREIDPATERDFRGLQVDWQRDTPIHRRETAQSARECSLVWRASETPNGEGWSVSEVDPVGRAFRWMSAAEASLRLEGQCRGNAEISIVIAEAMSRDILSSLRVDVASKTIELRSAAIAGGETIFWGMVPSGALSNSGEVPITLRVNRTIVPNGGARTLAVAVREVRLEPAPQ